VGLFSKLFQLKNAAKAGGNYGFIAQNVAAIYYAIPLTPFGKTLSEDKRLFATGLIDAAAYLQNGTIAIEDIERCVQIAGSGILQAGFNLITHRKMFDSEDNAELVDFTMQLEYIIFETEMPQMGYSAIANSIVQKKKVIVSQIRETLNEGTKSNIFHDVMIFTTGMMASPDFQSVVNSYKGKSA